MLKPMGDPRIYLDFNASTPVAPEVVASMRAVLAEPFGNPSSQHWAGEPAKLAVEKARAQVAALLACRPNEIVFTSGGTESNNYALKGTFFAKGRAKAHLITTQVEHPAVINPCRFLERFGATVTYLPVDGFGCVDPDDVRRAITPETILISVMHANNEVGTIQTIPDIARIAHEHDILFHTDAAQSVGKVATRTDELGVDLLSVAGHKLYGPKGVGALFIREHVRLEPLIHGTSHESGRRAGTENIVLDVGLGAACATSQAWLGMESVRQLRDLFWNLLQDAFGDQIALNGHPVKRLPNTLNVSFIGRTGSEILARVENIAASTGSACHSGSVELSPVLKAMKIPQNIGMGAIRFSLKAARVEFLLQSAEEPLPVPDKSIDTVVMTWTLCSIPNPLKALEQMRRVLKPSGQLIFIEHGRSPDSGVAAWQDRLNPLWKRIGGGCNLNLNIDGLLGTAGFQIQEMRTAYLPGPRPMTYTYQGIAHV